ncbi:hypothetical protein [Bacteroides sp.]
MYYSGYRYFPASGLRWREHGGLWNVGIEGDCRSSSSSGIGSINGGYLNFNSGNVNPVNSTNRTYAFALRCVQELTNS